MAAIDKTYVTKQELLEAIDWAKKVGQVEMENGHKFTKKTLLWERGVDPLKPTNIVEIERTWCPSGSYSGKHGEKHRGMFTKDRARNRSKTFPGIAKAMAEQWAGVCEKEADNEQ